MFFACLAMLANTLVNIMCSFNSAVEENSYKSKIYQTPKNMCKRFSDQDFCYGFVSPKPKKSIFFSFVLLNVQLEAKLGEINDIPSLIHSNLTVN